MPLPNTDSEDQRANNTPFTTEKILLPTAQAPVLPQLAPHSQPIIFAQPESKLSQPVGGATQLPVLVVPAQQYDSQTQMLHSQSLPQIAQPQLTQQPQPQSQIELLVQLLTLSQSGSAQRGSFSSSIEIKTEEKDLEGKRRSLQFSLKESSAPEHDQIETQSVEPEKKPELEQKHDRLHEELKGAYEKKNKKRPPQLKRLETRSMLTKNN